MVYYKVKKSIISPEVIVPYASFDKMSIEDRQLFDTLKKGYIDGIKKFDFFRSYGFGDHDDPKDVEEWEQYRYDFYHFMFVAAPAYLISDKLKSVIDKFSVLEIDKFYPAYFLIKNEKFDYHIFYQYHDIINLIDFEKTEFRFFDADTKLIRDYSGDKISKENFRGIMSDLYINKRTDFSYKKLVFKEQADVYGPRFDRLGYIMSERLVNALIENGITGMDFEKLDFEIEFTNSKDL